MKILSIETSCDETALAVLEASGDQNTPTFNILGTALYSQIEVHKPYGGVFPALAKREHATNLIPLLHSILQDVGEYKEEEKIISEEVKQELKEIFSHEQDLYEAFLEYIPKISKPNFDMIAVTSGPGLEPALWVGINFARALSLVWQIPVIPVNHMEGHLTSVLVSKNYTTLPIGFPAIALLISGGHTQLVSISNWGSYEILGSTKDDAVGEAFDKVARLLNLPYPGGPEISRLAQEAREQNLEINNVKLPRPMLHSKDLDFSFSGLKTAVLYLVKNLEKENKLSEEMKKKIALEFENSVTEVLYSKTCKAIEENGARTLILGGGVTANSHIRETFSKLGNDNFKVLIPDRNLSTDNAVMIAITGFLRSFQKKPEICPEIRANGNLKI